MTDREEALKLLDAGDDYGLMLWAVQRCMGRYHQEAEYATVVAVTGKLRPDVVVPVNLRPAQADSPLLASS